MKLPPPTLLLLTVQLTSNTQQQRFLSAHNAKLTFAPNQLKLIRKENENTYVFVLQYKTKQNLVDFIIETSRTDYACFILRTKPRQKATVQLHTGRCRCYAQVNDDNACPTKWMNRTAVIPSTLDRSFEALSNPTSAIQLCWKVLHEIYPD